MGAQSIVQCCRARVNQPRGTSLGSQSGENFFRLFFPPIESSFFGSFFGSSEIEGGGGGGGWEFRGSRTSPANLGHVNVKAAAVRGYVCRCARFVVLRIS